MKKLPQTAALFEHVFRAKQAAADKPQAGRLSIDTKAKVKLGRRSRGGSARTLKANQADDHATEWQSVLVPFGLLNTPSDQRSIDWGQSVETSALMVACGTAWWRDQQRADPHLDAWVIDLEGGSATRSDRTQLIKRMVALSQSSPLSLRLLYDPPDHSKDKPIARCWAALEHYWNGAILAAVATAVQWAVHLTWQGGTPIVQRVETTAEKGIKVLSEELEQDHPCWQRAAAHIPHFQLAQKA